MKIQELLTEMAKRVTLANFYDAAVKEYGVATAKDIKWVDVIALARKLDVTIPTAAHKNKTGRGRFNLSPEAGVEPAKEAPKASVKIEPVTALKAEPKVSKDGVTKAELQKEVPELDRDGSGDMLNWQISEYQGKINVIWDYTYRRMDAATAFKRNQSRIEAANERLKMLAKKYKYALVREPNEMTLASAKKLDQNSDDDDDDDDGYSEYEQSLGGRVTFKAS